MVIASLLRWWYVDGWLDQVDQVRLAFAKVADKFSIGLLARTLFAPFRQISADEQGRGASGMMNVFLDKLVSRMIGGFMRTVMMIVGIVSLVGLAVLSAIRLIAWPFLPIMPVVGLVMTLTAEVPWVLI